jgi:tripartite-type tricarboxylate transporter receptor subunit TctC
MGQSFIVENQSGGGGMIAAQTVKNAAPDGYTLMLGYAAYRGIGPAITDVLGGQTQMMMPGLAAALPHIKGGKLKAIAITGLKRHPLLPDTPTFEELGYKGFDLPGEALDPMPMTPDQFGKYMQADIQRWAKLAKERNIQLED